MAVSSSTDLMVRSYLLSVDYSSKGVTLSFSVATNS